MKVKIYYCSKCKKQHEGAYHSDGRLYCEKCYGEISIEDFEVEIPKPHIEEGTLIRVWNDSGCNTKIIYFYYRFHSFDCFGLPVVIEEDGYTKGYKNYELIHPDEINPEVKKVTSKEKK
jgi:hypothetical protein